MSNESEEKRRRDAIGRAEQLTEATAQRLIAIFEGSAPVQRLRASQLFSAIFAGIGFALFVSGIERAAEDLPFVSSPYGSIALGLVLLVATGLLLRKLAGGE